MGLASTLARKQFAITTEIMPPKGIDLTAFLKHAAALQGKVDAINVTENQRAMAHLGSIACCKALIDSGQDAIMHLVCRDSNRLGLQSQVMSGLCFGIHNFLVLGGDPPTSGDQPETKAVYDLDSRTALGMMQGLKSGKDMAGNELSGDFSGMMIGSAANPTAEDLAGEVEKTKGKIAMGATFFQTQGIYDLDRTRAFMAEIKPLGVPLLAGIIPLRNAKIAEMCKFKIPGMHVPDDVYERHINAPDINAEALEFSCEIIAALKGVVDGVHIMTIGSRKLTEAIIDRVHAMGLRED